jgi:hypothetical protein
VLLAAAGAACADGGPLAQTRGWLRRQSQVRHVPPPVMPEKTTRRAARTAIRSELLPIAETYAPRLGWYTNLRRGSHIPAAPLFPSAYAALPSRGYSRHQATAPITAHMARPISTPSATPLAAAVG